MFVFFKQKTAYEMRISDWSSDVCSSDLNLFRRSFRSFPILAGRLAAGGLPRSRREAVRMDARKRIAAAVKDHLARERISREQFAFKTRLGKSTIDKLLIGLFSDRTLSIVEAYTRSEEHTSELQSLMRISYAVFRL